MVIEKLDWDSAFFGYEVGKISLKKEQLLTVEDFLVATENFKLVYVFSQQKLDFKSIVLVDDKIVLKRLIATADADEYEENNSIQSFDTKHHSSEEIRKLALESGVYSRFYKDQHFKNNEYERLYLSWIDQSIEGKLAFDILVAMDEHNSIMGFITLNEKSSDLVDIGLVAVSKEARGKGIARSLLRNAFQKARQLGYKNIQVVTQNDNLPAKKLYESEGFAIEERTFVYHYWNL